MRTSTCCKRWVNRRWSVGVASSCDGQGLANVLVCPIMNISLEFPFSLVPVHVWWTWSGDPTATFLRFSFLAKHVVPSTCTTANTFPSCMLHPARLGARPSLPCRVPTCLILPNHRRKNSLHSPAWIDRGGFIQTASKGGIGSVPREEAGRDKERQRGALGRAASTDVVERRCKPRWPPHRCASRAHEDVVRTDESRRS